MFVTQKIVILILGMFNKTKHPQDKNTYEPGDFKISRTFNLSKEEESYIFLEQKKYLMKNTAMFPIFFAKEIIND